MNEITALYENMGISAGVYAYGEKALANLKSRFDEIDRLAVIHENFFDESGGSLQGMDCHELSFYFLMKPRGTRELCSNSTTLSGLKEEMRWIPLEDLEKYLYKPYAEMGGNGTAAAVVQKCRELPFISEQEAEKRDARNRGGEDEG